MMSRRQRREQLFGVNRRNVELIYPNNPRAHYPVADDKLICKRYLRRARVPVVETLAVCRGLFEVQDTINRLMTCSQFVVKPARGSGGAGIVVLGERVASGWQTVDGQTYDEASLRQHLASIVFGAFSKELEDQALIEERIFPHPALVKIWPHGLSDLRVLVLKGKPLFSMLRVPTQNSKGRANLHQGGLGVAVDLEQGTTLRALHRGVPVEKHPDTGVDVVGLVIPAWRELMRAAVAAARAVPLEYLGVDLTVDRARGPVVLEVNARPGLEIQNVNATPLGLALKRVAS